MSYAPPGYTKKDPVDPTTIDECWIQSTMYPNLAKYAANSSQSTYLNTAIITACAAINQMCNRKFNQQQYDYIIPNEVLFMRDYKTYVLPNRPLVSVDNVWVEVVDTFALVTPQYFQIMTYEGVLKILPTFSTYVQTTLPNFALRPSSNLWIRFTSGYAVDYSGNNTTNDVPEPIRLATAMYVDYLYSRFSLMGGVTEFKTQTYSQKNAKGNEDPILTAIQEILKPYFLSSVR